MTNLTKEQTIEQLCELAFTVGAIKFNHNIPHDCFCTLGEGKFCESFQFDQAIIDYIKEAVEEKLYNDEEDL